MKKFIIPLCLCVLFLSSCGYNLRGTQAFNDSMQSVFGDSSATVSIGDIEQVSIYPWAPYFITTTLRDEITLRNIATWQSAAESDYSIDVQMSSFDLGAFDDGYLTGSLISTLSVQMQLTVIDNITGEVIASTGLVTHDRNFESPREESALREVIAETIEIALDNFQTNF